MKTHTSTTRNPNANTTPSVTLTSSLDAPVTPEDTSKESQAITSFNSMVERFTQTGISRREGLQELIIHTVWFNFKYHKVSLIQKLLGVLSKDSEFSTLNFNRVIYFYTKVAGIKVYQVGNDFQIKRYNTPEFNYTAEHLGVCKLDSNNYWNLTQADPDKPYKAKELDTIKKSIASQVAVLSLLGECTDSEIEAMINSLKSAIVTAKADPKIKVKATKQEALKNALPETYDSE